MDPGLMAELFTAKAKELSSRMHDVSANSILQPTNGAENNQFNVVIAAAVFIYAVRQRMVSGG